MPRSLGDLVSSPVFQLGAVIAQGSPFLLEKLSRTYMSRGVFHWFRYHGDIWEGGTPCALDLCKNPTSEFRLLVYLFISEMGKGVKETRSGGKMKTQFFKTLAPFEIKWCSVRASIMSIIWIIK